MPGKALLLGVAMFAFTACTAKTPDTTTKAADTVAKATDTAADEASLKTTAMKWWELYNNGDAEGVANLYAEDGIILAAGSPAAVGRPAIKDFLTKDIAASKAAGLKDNGGEINGVGISGDLAWVSGAFAIVDAAGKNVDAGKYTTVYRREGSDWKIIRDTWNSDNPPAPAAAPKS